MPAKENMQNFFGKVDRAFKRQSEEEYRVHQITNPKVSWGPTPDEMDDIVRYCDAHSTRTKALGAIWDILSGGNSKAWKQVYKTLLLVEHLLLNASPETVREIQQRLNIIKSLEDFTFKDTDGVDRGVNVRKRAETVRELAMSDDIDERRRVTADTRARFMDVARNDASGLGSNFSVKQKAMLSTSSESVAMNKPNTTTFTPQAGMTTPLPPQQSLPQPDYFMAQNQGQIQAPEHQQMGMGMGFQQPAGLGMGQPRPQQFQVVQGNTMGMRLINQSQPQYQMQTQAQTQLPMTAPMQQYGTPSATPQAQEVPLQVMPQIQLLTPEQMMSMPPEQLQAYQQQLLLQKQQMAEMIARAQISQPAVPIQPLQAQPAMPASTAPVPMAQPQVSMVTPMTQPQPQLQSSSTPTSVPAQSSQQNFSNLLSFF
ncbi:Epsin related protein [Giardia muris]|uniref:Epsin related protein n=1 Tax=Giardia muris TaxID=5742 RepID=A0A4Z1SRM5_GIAMU|nr:Epsin related protein [Giardia muris]|eukprot:TNJ26288.1 Epsin related protein [Giardia muris]